MNHKVWDGVQWHHNGFELGDHRLGLVTPLVAVRWRIDHLEVFGLHDHGLSFATQGVRKIMKLHFKTVLNVGETSFSC